MPAEYTERRRFPRYPCDTGVRIHVEQGAGGFWGTISDISLGGCYIYTFSPLQIGQTVVLEIKANDKELSAKGRIASTHPGVGMGVAFTGFINAEGEQVLKSYIDHLASQPRTEKQPGVFH